MPRKSPFEIILTNEEREYLICLARKYTAPYRNVIRAQVILMATEGIENKEIGERLNLPRKTLSKWRKRFFYERKRGLVDRPRSKKSSLKFKATRGISYAAPTLTTISPSPLASHQPYQMVAIREKPLQ